MNKHNHWKLAHPSQLAHTFSIVARDPASGEMGAAVQSHWFLALSATIVERTKEGERVCTTL